MISSQILSNAQLTCPKHQVLLFSNNLLLFSITERRPYNSDIRMQLGTKILYGIFMILIATIAPIGNACLIYAIISTKKHREIVSNIHLVTLAITDFLGSVVNAPYFLISLNLPDYDASLEEKYLEPCKAGNFFVYAIGINRILALTVMSVDRYLAILHPFIYQRFVNRRRAILCSVFITMQSCVTNLPMSLIPGWVYYDGRPGAPCGFKWDGKLIYLVPYSILNFGIPLIVLLVTNVKVFDVARKQRRRILSMEVCRSKRKKRRVFGMLTSVSHFPVTANEPPTDKENDLTQNGSLQAEARCQCINNTSLAKSDSSLNYGRQMSASDSRQDGWIIDGKNSHRKVLYELGEQDVENGNFQLKKELGFAEKEASPAKNHMACSLSVQGLFSASAESSDSRDNSTGDIMRPITNLPGKPTKHYSTGDINREPRSNLHENELENDRDVQKDQQDELVLDARSEIRKSQVPKIQTQDIIVTFSTIVIVVLFLVSWSPFAFTRAAFVLDRRLFSWHAVVWTTALTLASSAGNPLIVLGTRRDLRETIMNRCKVSEQN